MYEQYFGIFNIQRLPSVLKRHYNMLHFIRGTYSVPKNVLFKLKDGNLKLQLDKCEFMKKETEFSGHIVTTTGINFPLPKTPKQIKSILGLCALYLKFIPNFANVVKPMNLKLKKGAVLDTKCKGYVKSFEGLKVLITNMKLQR